MSPVCNTGVLLANHCAKLCSIFVDGPILVFESAHTMARDFDTLPGHQVLLHQDLHMNSRNFAKWFDFEMTEALAVAKALS